VPDSKGWIPLMYANHAERKGAVLTLMASHLQEQLAAMHAIIEDTMSRPAVIRVFSMLATVPPFYDALNAYIGDHIHLLSGPLKFLLHRTTMVDFANRRTWLQRELESALGQRSIWTDVAHASLSVKHTSAWRGFCRWAMRLGPQAMTAAPLHHHMHFAGVMSMASGPGVEREFMDLVAANLTRSPVSSSSSAVSSGDDDDDDEEDDDAYEACGGGGGGQFDVQLSYGFGNFGSTGARGGRDGGAGETAPSRARGGGAGPGSNGRGRKSVASRAWQGHPSRAPLLTEASDGVGVYHPPQLPARLPPLLEGEYTVLGWILGYSILHHSPLPVPFSSAFLRGLLGRSDSTSWEDLEEMEPDYARSLAMVP